MTTILKNTLLSITSSVTLVDFVLFVFTLMYDTELPNPDWGVLFKVEL